MEPADVSLETRDGEPGLADFTAIATFDDDTEGPLDLVAWSVSSISAGVIDQEGHFIASETNGGTTEIIANHVGIEGRASLFSTFRDDIFDGVDESVAEAFANATPVDDPSATFIYPSDGVTVPRNIAGFVFLWRAGDTNVSHLRFQGPTTDISVYVTGGNWQPDADLWTTIAAVNRAGTVSVQVEYGEWDGSELHNVVRSPTMDVTVNRFDARGSVLYWAASDQAIMRIPFGSDEPARFWPPEGSHECVGCHTLSESRQRMVVTSNGVNGTYAVIDISDPEAPSTFHDYDGAKRATFHALSGDGGAMLGTESGKLSLYDFDSNAALGPVDTAGYKVTQPDWTQDGSSVVYVRQTGSQNNDMNFTGGEIVQVAWDGANFGTPTVLVPRDVKWNHYYPAYSPDGNWIAYNRSTGDAYADADAELWLMSRDGSINIRLDTANGEDNGQNSYPRWGPLSDDDVLWLAFSSKRKYSPRNTDLPQIWVSAIDPALAASGVDPSKPAFWMPGQDSRQNNHLPVWWSK